MAGKYEKKKEPSGRKSGKTALIVLGVILALVVVLVIALVAIYNHTLNKMPKYDVPKVNYTTSATEYEPVTEPTTEETTEPTTEATTEPTEPHVASREDYVNFLVVGQDAREGEQNHLADSMIVCTVNTYEKTLTLTSILRDTQLQVSGSYRDVAGKNHTYGRVKVNMIYASGYTYGTGTADAMGWMNQALYDNFGLEIDYNFELDFTAFVKAIDVLGGIDVELNEVEYEYMDYEPKVVQEVTLGMNHLDGNSALHYARMRHADGDRGDITRTERQRKVISAVLAQVKSMDLKDVQSLIDEVLPCISTSMTNAEITSTIAQMLPILKDLTIINSGTCPQEGSYGGAMVDIFGNGVQHSVLTFNPQTVKKYMRALTLGEGTIE